MKSKTIWSEGDTEVAVWKDKDGNQYLTVFESGHEHSSTLLPGGPGEKGVLSALPAQHPKREGWANLSEHLVPGPAPTPSVNANTGFSSA